MADLSLSTFSAELERLVAATAPAIVAVHSHRSRASGFVWRKGLVITADEALAEEGEIAVVLPGGVAKKATLAGRDPSTNVALLRVEGADATPARLDIGAVKPGALALVVGARDGETLAAHAIVSPAGRRAGQKATSARPGMAARSRACRRCGARSAPRASAARRCSHSSALVRPRRRRSPSVRGRAIDRAAGHDRDRARD